MARSAPSRCLRQVSCRKAGAQCPSVGHHPVHNFPHHTRSSLAGAIPSVFLEYCFKAKIRAFVKLDRLKVLRHYMLSLYDALALHQASPRLCECGLSSLHPHAFLVESLLLKVEYGNWVYLLPPSIPDRNKLGESYSMTDIGQYLPSCYLSSIILRPVYGGPTTSRRRPLSLYLA